MREGGPFDVIELSSGSWPVTGSPTDGRAGVVVALVRPAADWIAPDTSRTRSRQLLKERDGSCPSSVFFCFGFCFVT